MEDIAADDDLLSDMLLDSLEFEPKIATHKMNQAYRSPRYKTQDVIDIVRDKVVVDVDVNGALEALLKLDVIKKHVNGKTTRQTQEFQLHARRYLETYLPDSGVEFALTTRYKQASERSSSEAQTSKAGQAEAKARADADAEAQREALRQQSHATKGKTRMSGENGVALGTSKADLCVVATKPFKAGDLVILCKGGVKDLTKSEDEALREEAILGRERQKDQEYHGVLGQGRDFSVIRSARKGCSQLLLGPARFVNHDCDPNCEFHRLGQSQMVFKCLRNIGLNEEITTYYGDNYFEWGNSECMCRTCEERGKGAFAPLEPIKSEETSSISSHSEADSDKHRRTSQRKIPNRSPPPAPASPIATTTIIEKNGRKLEKTFHHHVSQREFDEDCTSHRGPKCTCLTCGTSFWAPETWWVPDECRRCERHYRIFKADWPGRMPTETGWDIRAKNKRKELERQEVETKRRKLLQAPSPGVSSNSDTDTPVKLSPLRETEPEKPVKRASTKAKAKRKKMTIIDDGTDEDAIDNALQRISPTMPSKGSKKMIDKGELGEDESDLTSVSEEDADEYQPLMMQRDSSSSAGSDDSTSSKPGGPKMLGKEAKTETLALYWGAPTGDRRKRRQSNNAPESLSKMAKKEGPRSVSLRKEHRRTASDVPFASSTVTKTGVYRMPGGGSEQFLQSRRDSLPEILSPPISSASSSTTKAALEDAASLPSPPPSASQASWESHLQPGPEIVSPIFNVPGLATKGPARTSVKNLAMAWSAGVDEGGRGSRRRIVRDPSQTSPLATTMTTIPAKKRMALNKEDFDSDPDDRSYVVKREEHVKREEEVIGEEEEAKRPVAVRPTAQPHQQGSTFQSTSLPATGPILPFEASPTRNVSPLAGPPPATLASRPGVVPGQPIRKNLRWGSGKVSNSRPLVGPAAPMGGSASLTSPLSLSDSIVPTLGNQDTPSRHLQGTETNGNNGVNAATSPSTQKDRFHSPLARAALHASAFSGQSLNASSNGSGNGSMGNNGAAHHGATPLLAANLKQRPASPNSLMGPPLSTSRASSNSPGIQSPHSYPSLLKLEEEQQRESGPGQ